MYTSSISLRTLVYKIPFYLSRCKLNISYLSPWTSNISDIITFKICLYWLLNLSKITFYCFFKHHWKDKNRIFWMPFHIPFNDPQTIIKVIIYNWFYSQENIYGFLEKYPLLYCYKTKRDYRYNFKK